MEHGHVGSMRLVWTALPGIVTLQIRDLDIRLKPNLSAIATKEIAKKISELRGEEEEEEDEFDLPSAHVPFYFAPYPYQQPMHDTTATKAAHYKIPPPPPVVRHARYIPNSPPPSYYPSTPTTAFTYPSSTYPSFPMNAPTSLPPSYFPMRSPVPTLIPSPPVSHIPQPFSPSPFAPSPFPPSPFPPPPQVHYRNDMNFLVANGTMPGHWM
eukprot:GHVQ01010405.1.p1 GENE.GHVQ01010405.1~~GHVQ01010405.1.p1  ORF type:complete len:211 (+),score=36.29 GHVQ01010405.1:383-1015(+)